VKVTPEILKPIHQQVKFAHRECDDHRAPARSPTSRVKQQLKHGIAETKNIKKQTKTSKKMKKAM